MAFPADYTKYQEVTIQSSQVSADLTDFVIYVDLADLAKAGSDIFDTCRSDGGDIRVTKSDGTTELPVEIVSIDTTGQTGEIHFKFTGTLSSSSDTTVRIWYNGTDTLPAATSTYGRNAVWSDWFLVTHMDDLTTSTLLDSTGNNTLTKITANNPTEITSGKVGNAQDFSTDYITSNFNPATQIGTGAFSVTAWFKANTNGSRRTFAYFGDPSAFQDVIILQFIETSTNTIQIGTREGTGGFADVTVPSGQFNNTWKYLGFTRTGSDAAVYIDGTSIDTDTNAEWANGLDSMFQIGAAYTSGTNPYTDEMDEFRVRDGVLNSNWQTTEWENQNSTSTFYTTSDEQTSGGSTNVTVTPATQVVASSVVSATVTAVANVSVSATTQVVTTNAISPSVSAATNAVLSIGTQTISVVATTPAVLAGGNTTVAVGVQSIAVSPISASVVVEASITVSPTTQAVSASAITPTVSIGTGDVNAVNTQTIAVSAIGVAVTVDLNTVVVVDTATLEISSVSLASAGGLWGKVAWQDTTNDWDQVARAL